MDRTGAQHLLHSLSGDDSHVLFQPSGYQSVQLLVLQRCGLPCCPADAAQEIKEICTYVSPLCGGYGCARDVIEQILASQGKWMQGEHAFAW